MTRPSIAFDSGEFERIIFCQNLRPQAEVGYRTKDEPGRTLLRVTDIQEEPVVNISRRGQEDMVGQLIGSMVPYDDGFMHFEHDIVVEGAEPVVIVEERGRVFPELLPYMDVVFTSTNPALAADPEPLF
ncbi:MAG TPA: hypothetical protein VK674_02010 [Candidatus Limnocylindria bacterium]|nr:hypothetical protein [Candidatus Limnocylindria bacterium]